MPAKSLLTAKTPSVVMALRHVMVADAHAMPVHWFYRTADIFQAFPAGLTQLFDAPDYHPSSIMSLHSKQQGGRQAKHEPQQNVVGDVILRDKAPYWDRPGVHYHQGMKAGDNTLNAHTVLWLLQAMAEAGGVYREDVFLRHYIQHMTASEASHPDTYAESYHRGFFANWALGHAPNVCASVTHDTPSIGGLVRVGPLALLLLHGGHEVTAVKSVVGRHLDLTHPDAVLKKICFQYVELINDLLSASNEAAAERCLKQHLMSAAGRHFKRKPLEQWRDAEVIGGLYSSACYIQDAWPSVLYLANQYRHNLRQALQVNAELGGDNVHRGAVLALLLTLFRPQEMSDWYCQLAIAEALNDCLVALGALS